VTEYRKNLRLDWIMQTAIQEIHRLWRFLKAAKYLLITASFPHSPQAFPQGLSTGALSCGYAFLVHIRCVAAGGRNAHFFAGGGFYHGENFVQKFGLDSS
jgi:hypothetical protein